MPVRRSVRQGPFHGLRRSRILVPQLAQVLHPGLVLLGRGKEVNVDLNFRGVLPRLIQGEGMWGETTCRAKTEQAYCGRIGL